MSRNMPSTSLVPCCATSVLRARAAPRRQTESFEQADGLVVASVGPVVELILKGALFSEFDV